MANEKVSKSNLDRLLTHLKPDSLEYLLLKAYSQAGILDREARLEAILWQRVQEARNRIDVSED